MQSPRVSPIASPGAHPWRSHRTLRPGNRHEPVPGPVSGQVLHRCCERVSDPPRLALIHCLDHDPDQRLRAARPDQHPAGFAQLRLGGPDRVDELGRRADQTRPPLAR